MPPMTMRGFCAPRALGVTLDVLGATLALTVTACSSPTQPNVSVAGARPVGPPAETQFSYYNQPVVLTLANGVATGGAVPTTTVDVATDAAFSTIVLTQAVTPDTNGQLTVVLNHLSAATTYYWRARTTAGNNPGTVSPVASFSIGPLLVIQAPVPVQPLSDTFQHKRPTFIATNATRTGPSGMVTYRFEVAIDSTFSNVVASGTVAEGPNQTSFTPPSDLDSGVTYYWRARAADSTTGVTSGYSAPQRFATVQPDDGMFRYNLALHLPIPCRTVGQSVVQDFAFDNALTVRGDFLRFALPAPDFLYFGPFGSPPFELDIDRSGHQLSGTIGGSTVLPFYRYNVFALSQNGLSVEGSFRPAHFLGSTDNKGGLTATFDGYIESGSLVGYYFTCSESGIAWTLTPHP